MTLWHLLFISISSLIKTHKPKQTTKNTMCVSTLVYPFSCFCRQGKNNKTKWSEKISTFFLINIFVFNIVKTNIFFCKVSMAAGILDRGLDNFITPKDNGNLGKLWMVEEITIPKTRMIEFCMDILVFG